jgi:hypothetical protein
MESTLALVEVKVEKMVAKVKGPFKHPKPIAIEWVERSRNLDKRLLRSRNNLTTRIHLATRIHQATPTLVINS